MTVHFADVDDLLADDLVRRVMRADRVDAAALRIELGRVAAKVGPRRIALAGARVRFGCEPRPAPLALRPAGDAGESWLCC